MQMGCIYLIRNTANSKAYIGQTISGVSKRWNNHCRNALVKNHRSPLYAAIRKYGKDAFVVSVITTCNDRDRLDQLEVSIIQQFDSKVPNGYNVADGGRTSRMTPEGRERIRQKMIEHNPMKNPILAKINGDRWKGENNPIHKRNPMKNPEIVARMAGSKRGKVSWRKGAGLKRLIENRITVSELMNKTGLSFQCIKSRLRVGWTVDRVLSTPRNIKNLPKHHADRL